MTDNEVVDPERQVLESEMPLAIASKSAPGMRGLAGQNTGRFRKREAARIGHGKADFAGFELPPGARA